MSVNEEVKKIIEDVKYSRGIRQSDVAMDLGIKSTYLSDVITASMTGHQDMSVFRRYTDIRQDTLKDVIDKTFKR